MAKKKSASAATPPPVKLEKPAKPTKKAPASKSPSSNVLANGDASIAATALGAVQIGATAGAVWALLSDKGDATLATIKKEIDAPADLILAAVGWLAREEKLEFTTTGKNTKLALK
ncbi:MAG: winged helix-turn-helix domain-containing protein [Bythopirellula sp.]|nr:winged helix-turn-helix domain-containing protein [Bythopirellula sp.]